MAPALMGPPPLERGEAGIRSERIQPQIRNNAPQFSVITRAFVKTSIVVAAARGILPARLATWLINAGGLRNA